MRRLLLSFAAMASVLFTGCGKPENTLRTLQDGVSSYASKPSDEAAAKIDANVTKLAAQMADLRGSGKTDQAERIAQQRDALQAQYAAARMTASLLKAKEAAANVGEAFRKVGEALSQTLKGVSTNQE